jgi:hypothetical protein
MMTLFFSGLPKRPFSSPEVRHCMRIPLILTVGIYCLAIGFAQGNPSPDLPELLTRAGKSVELFWDQMAGVTCIESVSQEKLGKGPAVLYKQESTFDYLILMHLVGDDISIEESRFLQKSKGRTEYRPLLVTSGFSTLALIFHPFYQNSYEFQWLGEESLDGQPCYRLRFQHVAGARTPSVLRLKGKDYPLRWQGTAWIQRQTNQIRKIASGLMEPMPELGLLRLDSEVKYTGCRFPETGEEYWLPRSASIDAETAHQHWRNIHLFSDYKQFTVKTKSDVAKQ